MQLLAQTAPTNNTDAQLLFQIADKVGASSVQQALTEAAVRAAAAGRAAGGRAEAAARRAGHHARRHPPQRPVGGEEGPRAHREGGLRLQLQRRGLQLDPLPERQSLRPAHR